MTIRRFRIRVAALAMSVAAAWLIGGCSDDTGGPVAPPAGDFSDGQPVYVFDQADLDALAGTTRIAGTLFIQSIDDTGLIDDLSPLSELIEVGGLVIGNTAVQDLQGLARLETCADELRIWGNDELRSLAGLESLTAVRNVEVLGNPALESVAALASVRPQRLHLAALDRLTTADVFTDLQDLEEISVRLCPRLRTLPQAATPALQRLEILALDSLSSLVIAGGDLPSIVQVDVRSLPQLVDLTALAQCDRLQRLSLVDLPNLTELPDLTHLQGLWSVSLRNLPAFDRLDSVSGLMLQDLFLDGMPGLTDLDGLASLPRLGWFEVKNCENLESLAGAGALSRGYRLQLVDNPRLTRFGDVEFAGSVESIVVTRCGFTDLSSFAGVTNCTALTLEQCDDLQSLTGLAAFLKLRNLRLEHLPALVSLGITASFAHLEEVALWNCGGIEDLSGIGAIPALHSLNVSNCPSLRGLEGPVFPSAVNGVRISGNPLLTSLDGLVPITSIEDLSITYNTALGDSTAFAFAEGLEFVHWVNIYGNDP